jgi:Putative Flp pilus-assembly TadE/G-like
VTRRGELGQSAVLIVGLASFLLLAIVVVVDASAAFLQRQGLDTVADGAALAGADAGSRDLESLYGSGVGSQQRLDQAETLARAAVEDYLDRTRARTEYPGLRYDIGFDPTDNSVVVQVEAPLDLPLTIPGSPARPIVGTVGSAVVQVEGPGG